MVVTTVRCDDVCDMGVHTALAEESVQSVGALEFADQVVLVNVGVNVNDLLAIPEQDLALPLTCVITVCKRCWM